MGREEELAIEGGSPIIDTQIPSGVSGPSVVGEEEIAAVSDLLRSQQLFRHRESSEATQMEREAADYLGVKHALMVNSGTSALICALTVVTILLAAILRDRRKIVCCRKYVS